MRILDGIDGENEVSLLLLKIISEIFCILTNSKLLEEIYNFGNSLFVLCKPHLARIK